MECIPLVVFYAIYEADSPFRAPVVQSLRHKIAHHTIHHIMAWAGPVFCRQSDQRRHPRRYITPPNNPIGRAILSRVPVAPHWRQHSLEALVLAGIKDENKTTIN